MVLKVQQQTEEWVHMLTCLEAWLEYDGIILHKGKG